MTGDTNGLSEQLEYRIKQMEKQLGRELHINSGRRAAANESSSHRYGLAADIRVRGGYERREVVKAALTWFARVGVYDQHVHVDIDSSKVFPVLWAGRSR